MPTTLTYIPLTPTTPVPVESSAQRFRVSRNDDLLCGGERGIWAAESSVGLRDAVRAAHIPFPCRGDTRVIPPHTLSSVATAGHNRVAEPPTARATSPDDESPTGDLSRAPHRLRLQICIPSRGWAAGPSQREPFRHPHNCTLFIVHWGDHPDHLGSASWITNIYGRTIQHLYYLPWGEDFVNQRTGSFSSMYTFSAKEKDSETGLSYFGSRYYSSELSIWLSVDPMSGKYPSLSPYVYCANNPVRLVDPNGDTVIAYDHFSKKMIRSYLKEIFGKNNLFRFSGYTLTINERHYEQYYQDASTDRQKLLDGFQDIITRSEKVIVKIVENKPSFVFEKSEAIRDENGVVIGGRLTGEFTSLPNKGGGASSWGKRFSSYLLGVDNSVRDNLSTDDGGLTGNPAATFTHELLDEVLNHYIYKRDNANSSKLDRVAFQNAALRTMNCKQRNGEDHE